MSTSSTSSACTILSSLRPHDRSHVSNSWQAPTSMLRDVRNMLAKSAEATRRHCEKCSCQKRPKSPL
eukprot:CAMPEP_0183455146 /NCGR_PEP_ID=MMETSP0370-20130417/125915_1 /TAXON_ID=268820 /ORGANISM="Peridinium aciculiferum, Strain PAER-2" /LENGTH=66 /DNA_ID=CAMNT_0025646719 /DNA_START=33 /DNA_END=229 /DNA_ORIENTATION=-